jgi:hypothetical protein
MPDEKPKAQDSVVVVLRGPDGEIKQQETTNDEDE